MSALHPISWLSYAGALILVRGGGTVEDLRRGMSPSHEFYALRWFHRVAEGQAADCRRHLASRTLREHVLL